VWAATGERPFDLEARSELPATLEAGARIDVEVEISNRGSAAWEPDEGFALSYHWLDRSGAVVEWDGARTPLPAVIQPWMTVSVIATVEVPAVAGELALQWDVVQEGVRWLTEVDSTPSIPIPTVVRYSHAFTVVVDRAPWLIAPGSEVVRNLVVRNDGITPWGPDRQIAVSYHWLRRDGEIAVWDGVRSHLPSVVPPGGVVAVEALVRAPDDAGRYRLQWDMVHEGVTWFSQRDPVPKAAPLVLVVAPFAVGPAGWAIATLLAGIVALRAARTGASGSLAAAVAVMDVAWCAGTLIVKQGALLRAAAQEASTGAWILICAGVALVLLPLLLLPVRVRALCCWAVAALATFVLFADLIYQRFFGDLLSFAVMSAGGQLDEVTRSVSSLLDPGDLWWLLDLLAGVLIVAAVRRTDPAVARRPAGLIALVLVAFVAGGSFQAVRVARSGIPALRQVFRNLYLAREIGVLNFHALDAGREIRRGFRGRQLADETVTDIVDWFHRRAPLRAGSGRWFGIARGYNLLMVQVESLQGFVLGLEVGGQEVTPFLNSWAKDALVFTEVTDQTAQGRSSDSELATQVSLLAPPTGAAAFRYGGNRFTGLPSVLGDLGYDTLSAVAFEGGFWNRQVTHAAYGFGRSLFAEEFDPGEIIGWGLNDRDFFLQMADRLGQLEPPFCALLLTLSLHHPFEGFPDHHRLLDVGDWEGEPLGNYLHMMSFFDRALEDLVTELEAAGLAEKTVLVLWGDHDAGLEWTPELAVLVGRRHDAVGWYLSQRVPVLLRVPGEPELSGELAVPAGHQDVAPTLLALMGVDPAAYAFVGRNLLGQPGDGPVLGEYQCWRDTSHLFLQGGGRLEQGQCYELPTLERVDVAACGPGFDEARRQVEVSRLVLEFDLQQRLGELLAGRIAAAPSRRFGNEPEVRK
jgi:phosphoglycerol transferase MdoB-like AlkP superfamily enzyme